MRSVLAALTATALTAGVLAYTAAPATAQVSGRNGVIVFDYRSDPAGSQIWSVDPRTRVTTNLSGANTGDDQAAVSPSGRSIAFRAADNDIWVMSITGANRRDVTPGLGRGGAPAWSPDGTKLVFEDNGNIDVVNVNGRNRHQILAAAIEPNWSPDGTRIAYSAYHDGTLQVYTAAPDGSDVVDISQNTAYGEHQPDWSPDSQHIAFNSNRTRSGLRQIFQANRDGSGITLIAAVRPSGAYEPTYSPDGTRLAFVANVDGHLQIINENLQTRQTSRITSIVGDAEYICWQPR